MSAQLTSDDDAVTVVVPTRNRALLLDQTLQSILNQQDVSVAVVVVDDASSDETPQVLSRYPALTVVRNTQPVEQRRARNEGALLARTPWIAFCDDDDLWAPQKLRRQLTACHTEGTSWSTVSVLFVDEKLNPIGGHRLRDPAVIEHLVTRQNVVPGGGSGVLVRKSVFDHVGGFREDAKYVEDWDLWIRLSQQGRAACVDELLVAQRQWSHSYSHQNVQQQYRAFLDVIDRYGDRELKPRRAGFFEVKQRLRAESRLSVLPDLPRILRNSPEDTTRLAALFLIPAWTRRMLEIRLVGKGDVKRTKDWLDSYRASQIGVVP